MGYFLTVCASLLIFFMAGLAMHLNVIGVGVLFLGIATVAKVSGYLAMILIRNGVGVELAFFACLICGGLLGFLFALIRQKVSGENFEVIGLASILASEALILALPQFTNGVLGLNLSLGMGWGGGLMGLVFWGIGLSVMFGVFVKVIYDGVFGRKMRAFRESEVSLSALGVNPELVVRRVLVFSSLMVSVAVVLFLIRNKFLASGDFGLPFLIEILTIAIVASKAKVEFVILSTLAVSLMPELLRFLRLPETMFANLRIGLLAVVLIVIVKKFSSKNLFKKRSV